jgi:predicted RecB family endonuclease
MKLEIDEEVLDGLVVSAITDAIEVIQPEIKRLSKIKKPKRHQQQDLIDHLAYIDALKKTRYYFGGYQYDPNK